jgi:hypothetical protein
MNNLLAKTQEANRTDKQRFDDLFGMSFASSEESAKVIANFRKKAIPVEDIVNIDGKLYYVDYPGYDAYTNPNPKAVYYEIRSK